MARLGKEGAQAPQTATPKAPAPKPAVEMAAPDLGGRAPNREPAPLGEPQPPFFIACHPDRWGVVRNRIVPIARRFKGSPGANGVDKDRAGRPVMGLALAEQQERGWTILSWDVDGEGTHYLRRVTATGGWVDRWTTVYAGSAEITFDEAGYVDWLAGLVERGIIRPCPLYVLQRLEAQTERTLGHYRDRGVDQRRIDRAAKDLEVIQAAIAERTGPSTPAATGDATPDVVV